MFKDLKARMENLTDGVGKALSIGDVALASSEFKKLGFKVANFAETAAQVYAAYKKRVEAYHILYAATQLSLSQTKDQLNFIHST